VAVVVPLAMRVVDAAQWNWNNHWYYNMLVVEQNLEREILGAVRYSPKMLGTVVMFGDKRIATETELYAVTSVSDTVE